MLSTLDRSHGCLAILGSKLHNPIRIPKVDSRHPLASIQNFLSQEKPYVSFPRIFAQLPQDILDEIASCLDNTRDCSSLALVSRSLNKPASRALYKHITFKPLIDEHKATFDKLMHTLRLRDDYFPLVRSIEIDLQLWKNYSRSSLNWVSILLGELLASTSGLRRLVFMLPSEWPEVKQGLRRMTCAFLAFGAGRGLNDKLALESLTTNLNPAELNLWRFLDDQENNLRFLALNYNHKILHHPKEPVFSKYKSPPVFNKLSTLSLTGTTALFHIPLFFNSHSCISTLEIELSPLQNYKAFALILSSSLSLKHLTLLGPMDRPADKLSPALSILATYPLLSLVLDTQNRFYTSHVVNLATLSQHLNARTIVCKGIVPFETGMKAYFETATLPSNRPDKITFEPSEECPMVKRGWIITAANVNEKDFWRIAEKGASAAVSSGPLVIPTHSTFSMGATLGGSVAELL